MTRALVIAGVVYAAANLQLPRAAAPTPEGTARISGIVVDAQARPMSRAIVRITGSELPPGRATISDEKGTFEFTGLPGGRFTLTASKPAYITSSYGAVKPGGTGTPVVLGPGATVSGLTLTMPRGGVIAGVVRDTNGAPVPAAQVYVVAGTPAAGGAPLRPETVNTDDRGAYRMFGMLPGSYFVAAEYRYSGGIGEVGMMSTSEVDATLARLRARGAGGTVKPPATPERTPSSIVRPTRTSAPAPVFHPGVSAINAATPVVLGLGDTREGVDIVYQLTRAVVVSGTVSGAGTSPIFLTLTSDAGTPGPVGFGAGPALQRRPDGDGEFVFTTVSPGKYTLMSRYMGPRVVPGGPPPAPGEQLFAMTVLDVTGDDIAGINLVMEPAKRVRGRAVFQGATQPAAAALSMFALRLVPAGNSSEAGARLTVGQGVSMALTGLIGADGAFEITGVVPGEYRLAFQREAPGWRIRSAMLGDRDVLDVPFEVRGDVAGIEVTLSDQRSQIAGRLQQGDGSPATGYFVVAFPSNRDLWTPGSRRVRSARPGTDGGFQINDMPAGDYYLAALTDADSADWQSAVFLAQVVPAAIRLSLGDGERKVQDLKIGR